MHREVPALPPRHQPQRCSGVGVRAAPGARPLSLGEAVPTVRWRGKRCGTPKLERTQNERRESAPAQRHRRSKVGPQPDRCKGGGGGESGAFQRHVSSPPPFLLYLLEHPVKEEPSVLQKRHPTRPHFSNSPCPQSTLSYLKLHDYVLNPHLSRQNPGTPQVWAPSARLTAVSRGLAWGLAQSGASSACLEGKQGLVPHGLTHGMTAAACPLPAPGVLGAVWGHRARLGGGLHPGERVGTGSAGFQPSPSPRK